MAPSLQQFRRILERIAPSSRLGRFTLYLLGVDLFLYVVLKIEQWLAPATAQRSALDSWMFLITTLLAGFAAVLALRWFRYRVMWKLRNRLIVTYIFIGVIPVALVLSMALVAGYLFAGQFATFLVSSDLQAELKSLEASNSTIAAELASSLRRGGMAAVAGDPALQHRPDNPRLSATQVTAWYHGQVIDLPALRPAKAGPVALPGWAKQSFSGVVSDGEALYLRVVERMPVGTGDLVVISSQPVDRDLLTRLGTDTGEITIYLAGLQVRNKRDTNIVIIDSGDNPAVRQRRRNFPRISGGKVPPSTPLLDREVNFATPFSAVNWNTGETSTNILEVSTRPSLLYARLFARVSEFGRVVEAVLVVIAVFFAVIELAAFLIGVGLTRTMTRSVAELYRATQHVNRGDLQHRIAVRSRDQLAALEGSFNSMTQSLQALIAEQKEKQRMENELAIAQEVQAQLFPREPANLTALEVHGVCRPARTVSGDYYDFLTLGPDRLGIAVGDISGKGISAALLMATVHSAVRAYEFGRVPAAALQLVAAGTDSPAPSFEIPPGKSNGDFSPATVLSLLNRQLYRSTPSEKYATMFLGVYDGRLRTLTYSNAGHLPPALIGADSSVQRLDTPGLVVGLFDMQEYQQLVVPFRPGDILLAFSDGVTEPENEFGEFGEERLIEMVRENRTLPLARISELITAAVADWIGSAEQPDDVTVVLARAL